MEYLWQVLLHAIEPDRPTLSCEECFVLLDYLSDLLASGYKPKEVLSLAEPYLRRCPSCRQEVQQEMMDLVLAHSERGLSQVHRPSPPPS
jgi:hypothetical protein